MAKGIKTESITVIVDARDPDAFDFSGFTPEGKFLRLALDVTDPTHTFLGNGEYLYELIFSSISDVLEAHGVTLNQSEALTVPLMEVI